MSEGFRRISVALRWLGVAWVAAILVIASATSVYERFPEGQVISMGVIYLSPALLAWTVAWVVDGFVKGKRAEPQHLDP